ncbi:endonuclease V [Lewinella sp. LCG006]|uniref:endonuclease V n=1 Tax=Lewinella sp. LCG006 TaxID=3231911 RepID=UPI0034615D7F
MIICIDVHYRDDFAQVAGVLFKDWTDEEAYKTYTIQTPLAGEYEPGKFYKRELPALLALLREVSEPLDFILVDSYVYLGKDKPGLGVYLYEVLDVKVPVIGLAKNHFRAAEEVEVRLLRGDSSKALFVTAIGCEATWATDRIKEMAGDYRLPNLVKLADQLSKA